MSESGVEVKPTVASSERQTYGRVALIAGRGPSERIAAILEREELSFDVFDDVKALLRGSSAQSPSLIVLWVEDSASGLLGCIEPLTRRFTQTPVVMVCPSIQRWEVRAALAAGAAGVTLDDQLDSALGPCLRAVQTAQVCVPREHWQQIEPPALSSREKQILGLVVMGYMNSQIAEQLFLAESTVKSHLSSAFGKLGVRSRNEAVNLILDPGRGLGMGILALGGEPLETVPSTVQ